MYVFHVKRVCMWDRRFVWDLAYTNGCACTAKRNDVRPIDVLRLHASGAASFQGAHKQGKTVHRCDMLDLRPCRCFGQACYRGRITVVDVQDRDPLVRALRRRIRRFPSCARETNPPASVAWVHRHGTPIDLRHHSTPASTLPPTDRSVQKTNSKVQTFRDQQIDQ